MTIYKFPSQFGRGRDPKKEKKKTVCHPEFIDIEDLREEERLHESEHASVYTAWGRGEKSQFPLFLRIFAFGSALALFIGSFLLFCLAAVAGGIALLTFMQVPSINRRFLSYWRYYKRLFVIGLGLLIICFSPALGMGFIALYFAQQGESIENNFLERFFRNA